MLTPSAGGLGRRASDGGANLQVYFQCHLPEAGLSQPNSHEQITKVGIALVSATLMLQHKFSLLMLEALLLMNYCFRNVNLCPLSMYIL